MKFSTIYDPQYRAESSSESGFMMVFAVVLVALMLIALAVAAPVIAKDLRRDKELESEHRGQQYVRAVRLYYRKFKTYPPSIEALEGTNNVRFLRKRYVDPLTGKDDWRIIHVGENKTTVKGFFGEPLGGLNTTGAGGLGSATGMLSNPELTGSRSYQLGQLYSYRRLSTFRGIFRSDDRLRNVGFVNLCRRPWVGRCRPDHGSRHDEDRRQHPESERADHVRDMGVYLRPEDRAAVSKGKYSGRRGRRHPQLDRSARDGLESAEQSAE